MQESILTTLVLPVALALIMLGLGLSLKSDDFLRIFKYPKAVTIGRSPHFVNGLIGQLVILPVIALAIAITAGILKDAEMAIPSAINSLFMYLTGFAVIAYGKKLTSHAGEIPSSDLS